MKIADSVTCQKSITYTDIRTSEKEARAFFDDFLAPILLKYHMSESNDDEVYEETKEVFENCAIRVGEPESYQYEFQLIRTRIRYFELIPDWEVQRIRDDMLPAWQKILNFRQEIIDWGMAGESKTYGQDKLDEMKEKYQECFDFMDDWANGRADAEGVLPHKDGHEHRELVKKYMKTCTDYAKEIENWGFEMSHELWRWKDGAEENFVSENYLWTDLSIPKDTPERAEQVARSKRIREFLVDELRENWRSLVWRQFHKMKFHQVRRI